MDPQKPRESQWTDDQWQAIVQKGKDVLVAAAAGSGKTAVLVERIIQKITDAKEPVDVDRLLIVTFTNAAASEMRIRIGHALEKELAEHPSDLRLRHQLMLLNKASITTSHSFCLSVVRRYYYQLDIDPSFRIGDEAEMALIREDILEGLFEDYYSADDAEHFYELVDRYSNDRSDSELMGLVQRLYTFSRSHPWPEAWLDEMADAYQVTADTSIDTLPWIPDLKQVVGSTVHGLLGVLETAEALASEPGGPHPYIETLQADRQMLQSLYAEVHGAWEALHQAFSQISFMKLKPCKGDAIDPALKERVKRLRDEVKKRLNQLQEELFSRTPASYLEDLQDMAPYVQLLVQFVKDFSQRYAAVKKEKAVVDFDDLEHFSLSILRDDASQPGHELASEVAKQYRSQFTEILVDEYQDTNLVQETIISHIARGDNTFMVGDVKQSIYRFRLAEPGLFLKKYKRFGNDSSSDEASGYRIDLSQNFRSRQEIVDGTNFIFKQIMDETIGEIAYDDKAALRFGATYYSEEKQETELHLINRQEHKDGIEDETAEDYETAELEGHFIAGQIQEMIQGGKEVYDKETKINRPILYRDIVILLRSGVAWAPTLLDVLRQKGIPAYAELSRGYFEATEIAVMMALLRTIDNPFQDIPLASVLRSPLVGLTGSELARIRIAQKDGEYYEAMRYYSESYTDDLAHKLREFNHRLEAWRDRARRGALADLIWQLYRETGYYDYVAGLSAGEQRQANLRALYDRARQYEQTSFRGLFRFLRFVERLQDRGGDLAEARALSEQEDVVRVMTIHKSKGLEFPVVFVAGINKRFNFRDVNAKVLLHKTLGFGTKNIDPVKRFTTLTLPHVALKRRMASETIAEEMRILYVALTRAREKLILVGTLRDAEKAMQKWSDGASEGTWTLSAYARMQAKTFLDWLGPSILRHKDATVLHDLAGFSPTNEPVKQHPSQWLAVLHAGGNIVGGLEQQEEKPLEKERQLQNWLPVDAYEDERVAEHLAWRYAHQQATVYMAKQTVTEIKRQQEHFNEGYDEALIEQLRRPLGDRPRFLSGKQLTPTERGTAVHKFMQHVKLTLPMSQSHLDLEATRMVQQELLTEEESEAIDFKRVVHFFETEIGQDLLHAKRVVRELSFSLAVQTEDIYSDWQGEGDTVLVQGVVDCLYETESGLVLLDFKTDQVAGQLQSLDAQQQALMARYRTQLELYRVAIKRIWKQEVEKLGLYFFDGGYLYTL